MKAHLPEALRQQLQALERERKESAASYAGVLEQRILNVDREMLDKLSANHDEAGQYTGSCLRLKGGINFNKESSICRLSEAL